MSLEVRSADTFFIYHEIEHTFDSDVAPKQLNAKARKVIKSGGAENISREPGIAKESTQ